MSFYIEMKLVSFKDDKPNVHDEAVLDFEDRQAADRVFAWIADASSEGLYEIASEEMEFDD